MQPAFLYKGGPSLCVNFAVCLLFMINVVLRSYTLVALVVAIRLQTKYSHPLVQDRPVGLLYWMLQNAVSPPNASPMPVLLQPSPAYISSGHPRQTRRIHPRISMDFFVSALGREQLQQQPRIVAPQYCKFSRGHAR